MNTGWMRQCSSLVAVKRGVTEFAKEHPDTKQILVSRDRVSRRSGDVDLYYVTDFFKALWAGEII